MKKIFLIVVVLFISGCRVYRPVIEETGHYYKDSSFEYGSINSITVVELQNLTNYPEINKMFSDTLFNTIRKKHLFEIKYLSSFDKGYEQCMATGFTFDSLDELKKIQQELGTDGIIYGRITDYKPYPSTLIGLKLSLVNLTNGKVLWSIEQVWDTTDKAVENRIKRFFEDNMRQGYEPMDWEIVRVSPKTFQKFVSYEICSTLPSNSYLKQDYVDKQKSVIGNAKNQALRPIVRFPDKAKEVIGLNQE